MNLSLKLQSNGRAVLQYFCRGMSQTPQELNYVRNIGILAHIDAGKTTTTERMLYYSGSISRMGEVHLGTTTTDYMTEERERGITIASAFVKFMWDKHLFNLVDTPGHIDFTMEVEHALNVIDSAVMVLDSSAGVEAQTLTVWHQITKHRLPCVIYLNKMDRKDADLDMCLESLRTKLSCLPLLIHTPLRDSSGFKGVVDVPALEKIHWSDNGKLMVKELMSLSDKYYLGALDSKMELVDTLSSMDDILAEKVIENGSLESITTEDLNSAIRRVTIAKMAVPVVCGSSYKNIGVQTLMDAVIKYLPSPVESWSRIFSKAATNDLIAKSFKVIHDKQRGPITFFRVYNGEMNKNQKIYNANQGVNDQIGKILLPFADDFEEVASVTKGNFVAVTGLKETSPGDFVFNSASAVKNVKEYMKNSFKLTDMQIEDVMPLQLRIPEPVFFCSIEISSQAHQLALDKALSELQREDPSFRVRVDDETGQTILSGMGELHLEIIKDRIKTNYKLDVDLGPIQIAYKEMLLKPGTASHTLTNSIGTHEYTVLITLSIKPGVRKEFIRLDMSGDSASNLAHITNKQLNPIVRGIKAGLAHGPSLAYEVIDVHAVLHWLEAKKSVPDSLLASAASHCVRKILNEGNTSLMEPIMSVNVTLPNDQTHKVLSDLSRRRATIANINDKGNIKEIECEVPLAELLGYSSFLRTFTSGTANLSMKFDGYSKMSVERSEYLKSTSIVPNFKR